MKCAVDYARKKSSQSAQRSLQKRISDLDPKKTRKELRELNRKSVSWQLARTQESFNRMRVQEELLWFAEKELEPTCISCGQPLGNDQWCCGHYKTVGAQSGLRFDPKNAHLQHNRRCNQGLSGDIGGTKTTRGYTQGLKDRFGEEEGQAIIDYCETNTSPVKWTCSDLEDMRRDFNHRKREAGRKLAQHT